MDYSPMDPNEPPESFDYYYVSFDFGAGRGCRVIPQRKGAFEFNFPAASKMLLDELKIPAIILFWQETTYKRYLEFRSFGEYARHKIQGQSGGPGLSVLQGGGEGSEPRASLVPVKPPEDPSTGA